MCLCACVACLQVLHGDLKVSTRTKLLLCSVLKCSMDLRVSVWLLGRVALNQADPSPPQLHCILPQPSNVLLMSDASDPRGFIAKISDFGLSRCEAPVM